jgi:hypothetical protein
VQLAEKPSNKLLGAIRSCGITLILIAITSIHFFITPTPIRVANAILTLGLALTIGSLWPVRRHVLARVLAIGSGAQAMKELGAWLTGRMEAIEARTRLWHIAAVLAALFVLSLFGSRGGILDVELDQYIPHYLSDRSLLARTFDSTKVEVDPGAPETIWHGRKLQLVRLQRPRPVSYLVDCLDANVIAWSVSKGVPHLLSASFIVFLIVNYVVVWLFCRKHLELDRYTSGLLVCLLASDPVLACNWSYDRSAKSGTSTFLLAGFCMAAALLVRRHNLTGGVRRMLLVAGTPLVLLIACLFDEQGVFLTAILAVLLFVEWHFPGGTDTSKTAGRLFFGIAGALIAFAFYGLFIHPKLCVYFGDVPPLPSLAYQAGAVRNLMLECFARIGQGLFLLVDQFRFLTGYQVALPAVLMMLWMGAVSATGAARIVGTDRPDGGAGTRRGVLIHLSIAAGLIILVLAALSSRHEFILRLDLRRWLYSEPTTMALMLFLMLTTAAVLRSHRFSRPVVQLILLGMFIGNLWSLPEHRRILRSGYWSSRLDYSVDFINALKPGAKTVPPEILSSGAYQALKDYVPKR